MKHVLSLVAVIAFVLCGMVRAEDKTFKPDDDGFIRNWLMLDTPISLDDKAANHDEDNQKEFFNKDYITDQKKMAPAAGQKVKIGDSEKTWKAIQSDEAIVNFDQVDNALFLAVVYITCEAEIPGAMLSIGSDDSSLWRLNGEEIVRVYSGRGVDKDQDKSKAVTLKKGANTLTAAVINGGGPTGMCARFVDKDDKPIKGYTISLTPPK
jgi:hypothetical protein